MNSGGGGDPGIGFNEITCPSCQAITQERLAFCHECGAPIGTGAALDPLATIHAEGFLLRKAVEGRPKLIVLLGVWILFLPAALLGSYFAVYLVIVRRGLADWVFFWAAVGLTYISLKILYKVTRNYCRPSSRFSLTAH